jgi:hypothetical protein
MGKHGPDGEEKLEDEMNRGLGARKKKKQWEMRNGGNPVTGS